MARLGKASGTQLGMIPPIFSLLIWDASVITTLVALVQWASKLGIFGWSSAHWATLHWRARWSTTAVSFVLWSLWAYI
jgi:hypothetical protein